MPKLLLITYYWPPAGGPGVQRSLKFVKYLVRKGWQIEVLTVSNGEFPAIDTTLFKDVPEGLLVHSVAAFEPHRLYRKFTGQAANKAIPVAVLSRNKKGLKERIASWIRLNLFIPDAKRGWIAPAARKGKAILEGADFDLIFSSSPPPSVHLIARRISLATGIPWVADFRDPWTKIHYYSGKRTCFARHLDARLEKMVIRDAQAVTCVSHQFLGLLPLSGAKGYVIPNGYDAEDRAPIQAPGKVFKVVYIGGLNANRFYPTMMDEIILWLAQRKEECELLIAGSIDTDIVHYFESKNLEYPGLIRLESYMDHPRALETMNSASCLLLFLERVESYGGHIPGKVFEYINSHVPVLAIGPEKGATSDLLEDSGAGKQFLPTENADAFFLEALALAKSGRRMQIKENILAEYTREKLSERLIEVFNTVLKKDA